MIPPDDFAHLIRWTPRDEAVSIAEETEFILAMREWERQQAWRRLANDARDFALLALVPATLLAVLFLFGGAR